MKVRWSDGADRDRGEIIEQIWIDNPLAAAKMDLLIEAATARLGKFPRMGRSGAIPGTREFIPHPSYRLVYELRDDEVVIHALTHTSRLWPPTPDEGG